MFDEYTLYLILDYAIRIIVLALGTIAIGYIRKYNLEKWVRIAVQSAEMIFQEIGMGADKKRYVIDFINDKFKWFKLTEEQLDALIEAAVLELNKIK